ncbi:unnamed protein product [Musa acuminata var. zebrina]
MGSYYLSKWRREKTIPPRYMWTNELRPASCCMPVSLVGVPVESSKLWIRRIFVFAFAFATPSSYIVLIEFLREVTRGPWGVSASRFKVPARRLLLVLWQRRSGEIQGSQLKSSTKTPLGRGLLLNL